MLHTATIFGMVSQKWIQDAFDKRKCNAEKYCR